MLDPSVDVNSQGDLGHLEAYGVLMRMTEYSTVRASGVVGAWEGLSTL